MKGKIKTGSRLYEYLDKQGVLTSGNNQEIEKAKKQYWLERRREYKRRRYKEQKSYTVFFTTAELTTITTHLKKSNGGVTQYIKQATLASIGSKPILDKKIIGQIREALAQHYFLLQTIGKRCGLQEKAMNEILSEAESVEKKLIDFIQ